MTDSTTPHQNQRRAPPLLTEAQKSKAEKDPRPPLG